MNHMVYEGIPVLTFISFFVMWQASNLIYVDQPTGTGFSYSSDDDDIRHNEQGVSNDLYDFLQVCLHISLCSCLVVYMN